ncbi:hypothetical protein N657DRAFT_682026 [Parathielavia appendiculata]|uniref:Uncharacterized protein n=1 Tax=Parathielavia appendiculata TaxID=2587402 RepID=A0AAN6Z1L4_9PEZI|nr:hypothetical protein N657DRAFT_682026 [Parathielavia appendiculata]
MSGESYIFLRNLGIGSQSVVQLVGNIFTQVVVARKTRILDHLNVLAHSHVHPFPAFTTRWAQCFSHENIPNTSGRPRPREECLRVSYWTLCNAETLDDWARNWRATFATGSFGVEQHLFPVNLIARAISQASQTLQIMYHAGA